MEIHRDGDCFSAMHCTGPTCIYLTLRVCDKRTSNPSVTTQKPTLISHHAAISDSDIIAAVLSGSDRANRIYGSRFHPVEIRHSIDHYQPSSCLAYLAFKFVENAAVPSFASSLQAAVTSSPLSFHKLAIATSVPKSALSQIAKSGSVDGVETNLIVKLLEHFKLTAGG